MSQLRSQTIVRVKVVVVPECDNAATRLFDGKVALLANRVASRLQTMILDLGQRLFIGSNRLEVTRLQTLVAIVYNDQLHVGVRLILQDALDALQQKRRSARINETLDILISRTKQRLTAFAYATLAVVTVETTQTPLVSASTQ